MNQICSEILEKYQVRKTKKQKTEFIEFMRAHFPELYVEEGGLSGNRNIVIGDPNTAKAVFGAHYDTQPVLPFPNFLMPKNRFVSILYAFVIIIPIVIITVLVGKLGTAIINDPEAFSLFALPTYWGLFFAMFFGPANKHTVNDNTSGVITLIELMTAMTEEQRAQSCFVFFDNEEKGLLGSAFFAKEHKEVMKNKFLINFDCVSDGDYLMLISDKKSFPEHEEKLKAAFADVTDKTVLVESAKGVHYPSDQKNFKKNIGVAAFNKSKFGLYVDKIHTAKDTVMDERNIEVIVDGTVKFFETL